MADIPLLTFNQILILFLLMLVGYISSRIGIITSEFEKKGSELLIKVTSPSLILTSFSLSYTPDLLKKGISVMCIGFLAHLAAILISYPVFGKTADSGRRRILMFASIFSNCAFMGFPVIIGVFGNEGIFLASFYIISFNITIWTYGYILMTGGKGFSLKSILNVIKNPTIPAIFIGLALFVLSIKLPYFLSQALEYTGSMTTPLSMLLIGSQLAKSDLSYVFRDKGFYMVAVLKLIIIPFIVLTATWLLRMPFIAAGVAVMLAGMPTAANTAIFARLFVDNENAAVTASRIVVLITMLSIITIPLIITAVNAVFQ